MKFSLLFVLVLFLSSCGADQKPRTSSENQDDISSQRQESASSYTYEDLRNAALNGNLKSLKKMKDQGVDLHETDALGRTALMFASYNGHTEIIQFLAENGAEIQSKNSEGRTPLMFAASGPFPETVRFLLEQGADPNVQDNVEGWTPLMYASAEGNLSVVQALLEYQADVSIEDTDGETAIDFAKSNGHREVVTLLEENL